MPNIPLSDGFGLNVQASLNSESAFAKYFKNPPGLKVVQTDLAALQNVPLTQFPLDSPEIGLTFTEPTSVTTTSPQFAGCAAVSAKLCVVSKGKLFSPDPYDSPIDVPSGHAYLGIGVDANLAPGVDLTAGKLDYGFAVKSDVSMTHYQSYATTATTPTFKDALQSALQRYVIPLSPDDLTGMQAGDIAVIEGNGSLEVSGTFNLLTSVNPLATLSSSVLPTALEIQEGASIKVCASCKITGDLQIRVQKVDADTVRLGFYRKRGVEFNVQVNPSIGVTAGTSSTDFIASVLKVIGPSPVPSADQFKAADLSKDQQSDIVDALQEGIQRSLAISIHAELDALASNEAAFLYEIKLSGITSDGQAALQKALRLNLSGLSDSTQPLPAGIREIQSLLTTTRKHGTKLKLNILGIYNYVSVNELLTEGKVLTDAVSGEVVITDKANASRISGAVSYLADTDKLRKLLAQSFLITTAYRCSALIAHAPTLKVSYWHFDEHASTNGDTMAADLNVLVSLGLMSAAQKQQDLAGSQDFGKSTFYVNTDYDDALSHSLFLQNDGQARTLDDFEQIGRKALQLLIPPDGNQAYRLQALQDGAWQKVQETGGTAVNLAQIFPNLKTDTQIPYIAGDYILIEWWAKTMAHMAQSLSAARRFFSQTPPPATDSAQFKQVQTDLARQMASVATNTHDQFSDPWGLLAMDLASGQKSAATARFVSPRLTLSLERSNKS